MDLRQFNDFFSECRQGFIRFAHTYVHDEMVAEDIVMEAFMYYWNNRENLPEGANPQAYVLTVIKHRCIDHLRHEQVSQDVHGELYQLHLWELSTRIASLEDFEPSDLFTDEIRHLVARALAALPEQTRRPAEGLSAFVLLGSFFPGGINKRVCQTIKWHADDADATDDH